MVRTEQTDPGRSGGRPPPERLGLLVDTARGGFIDTESGKPDRKDGWRAIRSYKPIPGEVVDVWMTVSSSPRSMGIGDSFGIPDAWREGRDWFHMYRGAPALLEADYITHWRPGGSRLAGSPA